ncbi:hypothetical protein M758_4G216500 [Ceratodon purpureus]|nr:hypothetical protein M758_4G216500 [Ceratodon purpureus]
MADDPSFGTTDGSCTSSIGRAPSPARTSSTGEGATGDRLQLLWIADLPFPGTALAPAAEAGTLGSISCSRGLVQKRRRLYPKAKAGRGQGRSAWVEYLYPRVLEQYRKSGVKFSAKLLRELALSILTAPDSEFNIHSIDPKDNILLTAKITNSWIQQFMDSQNIVLLSQRGRLICSPSKELHIEMHTAFHMGVLRRGFLSGIFHEHLMENLDETHFVINLDNGKTLEFRGDTSVKYTDVVSGGESMTLVVRISGGRRSTIEAPMIIFTNENRSYPIRGLIDNVPGVTYRSGPKGWMDQSIMPEFFLDPRAYQGDLHGQQKIVWLDNCSGHTLTPRLEAIPTSKNTKLNYLPPCSTHLCQPAYTFIISKIKDSWTRKWEAKKTKLIQANGWQDQARVDGQWSWKLINPSKRFFLELAAFCVDDVNREVDHDNISYARKAMIRCGLALGLDGTWSVAQLFPHLQEIVGKHLQYFQGQEVPPFVRAP